MSKEQTHNWARYIMLAIVISGVGIGIYTQILDNTHEIKDLGEDSDKIAVGIDTKVAGVIAEIAINRTDIKAIERRQDKTELNQVQALATSKAISEALSRMETSNANFRTEVSDGFKEQRTANKIISDKVIETSTKVNTLIKGR